MPGRALRGEGGSSEGGASGAWVDDSWGCLSSCALRRGEPPWTWGGQGEGGGEETGVEDVDSLEIRSGPPWQPGGGQAEGGVEPHEETDPGRGKRSAG